MNVSATIATRDLLPITEEREQPHDNDGASHSDRPRRPLRQVTGTSVKDITGRLTYFSGGLVRVDDDAVRAFRASRKRASTSSAKRSLPDSGEN